jgi:hypothetical protein
VSGSALRAQDERAISFAWAKVAHGCRRVVLRELVQMTHRELLSLQPRRVESGVLGVGAPDPFRMREPSAGARVSVPQGGTLTARPARPN